MALFLHCVWLSCFILLSLAAESAWNGYIPQNDGHHPRFTPFYSPPGTKFYDSASPLLYYTGTWSDSFSSAYVERSMRLTSQAGATVTFSFIGTGIEWFGNQDDRHGIAEVYIDGKLVQRVDNWSAVPRKQQRLFGTSDLLPRRHIIRIVNTGDSRPIAKGTSMDVDALTVTLIPEAPEDHFVLPLDQGLDAQDGAWTGFPSLSDVYSNFSWQLMQRGHSGVSAMQLAVVSDSHVLVVDKVEHNPLTVSGHPAWAALYNLRTHEVTPLDVESNSFCASGTFLSNGTLVNVGGNPVVEDRTSAWDFGDLDGLQAIRLFHPCDDENIPSCGVYENHSRLRMASPRWYSTTVRLHDGSVMIVGGSRKGGWINNATVNNPTVEYWPPKNIVGSNGLPVHLPFLVDTLNANLFPAVFLLPDGRIFMAANQDAMIYDWESNTEYRLPRIPNGVRVTYPMAGSALLLPFSPDNDYAPEVLICGGSTIDDTAPGYEISSQDPASSQCSRLLLSQEGIAAGWVVEHMPHARTMPDAVLLPTGQIVLVNGAASGISGYGNVLGQIGQSNADNPVLVPVLYDPVAPLGERFSTDGMPASDIPRMYHSVATLTPRGDVMIAGSNPNLDRSELLYRTEYRVEWLSPPYIASERPRVLSQPKSIGFGEEIRVEVQMPLSYSRNSDVRVALMDFGFVTHAVHANSRLVYLDVSVSESGRVLGVVGPPHGAIYPPGPGWLFIVVDNIPSTGSKVMVGDGGPPPVDEAALENMLNNSVVDQYELSKKKGKKKGKNQGSNVHTVDKHL